MADSKFPRRDGTNPRGDGNLFGNIISKNCMKIKDLDQGGVRLNAPSLYLPMFIDHATPRTPIKAKLHQNINHLY